MKLLIIICKIPRLMLSSRVDAGDKQSWNWKAEVRTERKTAVVGRVRMLRGSWREWTDRPGMEVRDSQCGGASEGST